MSSSVIIELEKQDLVYNNKLKSVQGILPWIKPCLKKLSKEKLDETQIILNLTFVSCIALMMEGWYVRFTTFFKLEKQLPLKQFHLRLLEIQSKYLLENFTTNRIWRLHHSIPYKLHAVEP